MVRDEADRWVERLQNRGDSARSSLLPAGPPAVPRGPLWSRMPTRVRPPRLPLAGALGIPPPPRRVEPLVAALVEGLSGQAIAARRPQIHNDVPSEEHHYRKIDSMIAFETRSLIAATAVSQVDPVLEGVIGSWITAARARDPALLLQVVYPLTFSEAWIAANQAALDLARERYERLDYDAFLELLLSFSRLDVTAELHKITAPTLVIVGEEDLVKPRKYADIIARDEDKDAERPEINDLITQGLDPQLETALLILQAKALETTESETRHAMAQ